MENKSRLEKKTKAKTDLLQNLITDKTNKNEKRGMTIEQM